MRQSFIFRQHFLLTNKGPSLPEFLKNKGIKVISNPSITYFIKVYGCQMNTNDSEIFNSIMHSNNYQQLNDIKDAKYVFLMTCAIREKAESKIWHEIAALKRMKKSIGILGCMAENLKEKLLDKVDLIAGPDTYKDIPLLINALECNPSITGIGNVQLSTEETYADIIPIRTDKTSKSAYVSITRGCNNMCSFCIVPFTRGIERSRPFQVILDEVARLRDEGIKEITFLGQNVNSYNDKDYEPTHLHSMTEGFSTLYTVKTGARFTQLLDKASDIAPQVRFKFTSPHPKDFPMDLLKVIHSKKNICKSIHLPMQSGSTAILNKMRRGYSKEAYLNLALTIRKLMPYAVISTDIITGFCDETDKDFEDTLDIVKQVKFEIAYMFAYSMRPKTHAFHNFKDNVPQATKIQRLKELIRVFHSNSKQSLSRFIGKELQVLVEKKGKIENQMRGKTDIGISAYFTTNTPVPIGSLVKVKVISNTSASFETKLIK